METVTVDDRPAYRLIVAGGRDFYDRQRMITAILKLATNELDRYAVSLVSGMAQGADKMAYDWAIEMGITVDSFPANWKDLEAPGAVIRQNRFGPYNARAGHDRNQRMAKSAQGLLAFWDGKSTGTKDMIDRARALHLDVRIINY